MEFTTITPVHNMIFMYFGWSTRAHHAPESITCIQLCGAVHTSRRLYTTRFVPHGGVSVCVCTIMRMRI